MILTLPHHPCFEDLPAHLMKEIVRTPFYIGFWKGPDSGAHEFPEPKDFVDETWYPDERAAVVRYLESFPFVNPYRGDSWCRFRCGIKNGYREHSDGTYTWPEGFSHYIAMHGVRPPAEFIMHALKKARP